MNRYQAHRLDADGTALVGVQPWLRSERVWLSRADYQAVLREVGRRPWYLRRTTKGREYVGVFPEEGGRAVPIARIFLGTGPGHAVHHLDGDPFNLRRSNLTDKPAPARKTPSVAPKAAPENPPWDP